MRCAAKDDHLRAQAAASLTNISELERGRRGQVGAAGLVLTVALAAYLLATGAPGAERWPIFFPLALSSGAWA